MDTKERLEFLKQLQITVPNEIAFKKHDSLLSWINKVAPLLKYDDEHYSLFRDAALKVSIPNISSQTAIPCLNIMRGVVDRAITELEHNLTPTTKTKKEELQYPDKITLKWLWENVPFSYLWSFLLVLVFVFSLGVTFAQTNLYKSLIERATAITKTNVKIENTKQ